MKSPRTNRFRSNARTKSETSILSIRTISATEQITITVRESYCMNVYSQLSTVYDCPRRWVATSLPKAIHEHTIKKGD
jgi:hypothetical protein